ncbi:hypothetical protein M446_0726 [Methylobacterium sp. 4-46]|uniref:hypothetical protein n=1 Tax=unclassified Methylobacterium TaxID=2615210 RepID=UPI000165C76F|nr:MULTISPECIES: hypothetical protein [Methylobacterium]ACA15285.1 hypothetical protein M446_0726 [Methylobacterium sp. 4-46]WFT81013.1 hypothetical protein QA634_03670 [Methylobacterium nodulans]
MRKIGLFVAAFALATVAFWATMLTDPPRTQAKMPAGIDTTEITLRTPLPPGAGYDTF